jgi:hypothetical protein
MIDSVFVVGQTVCVLDVFRQKMSKDIALHMTLQFTD